MKKIILFLLISLFGLFFTACGGELETTVELEQDLSGCRTMKYVISKEDFSENSNVSIGVAEKQIATKCPAEFEYEFKQTEDEYILTFTMPFASLEDAQAKMEAVAGKTCEIAFYQGEGVFCEGFSYEEKFDAELLFSWFEDVLVNCGCVNISYQSYIIEKSNTTIFYGGKKYTAKDTVVAKDFSYIEINNLEIATYVNGDGTYDRTLAMSIQEVNLNKKRAAIEAFMAKSIPTCGEGEWSEENGMHTHTVTLKKLSETQMQDAMRTYTHSEDTIFETRDGEADAESYVLLSREISYAEYLDLREYGSNEAGQVNVTYIQQNENMSGELYFYLNEYRDWDVFNIFGDEWKVWNFNNQQTDKVGDGIQTYPLSYLDKISLVYKGSYFFDVTQLEWDTKVYSQKKIENEIAFSLAKETSAEETDMLIRTCTKKIEEEKLSGVTVKKEETDGIQKVVFTMKGSDLEINKARGVLTHVNYDEKDDLEEKSMIMCFEEAGIMSLTKTIVFEETVWPAGFLAQPDSYKKKIPILYSLEIAGKEIEQSTDVPAKILYGENYTEAARVGVVRETVNFMGILWMLLIVLGLISLTLGMVFFLLAVIKKYRNNKKEKAQGISKEKPMPERIPVVKEETPSYDAAEQLVADLFGQNSDSDS